MTNIIKLHANSDFTVDDLVELYTDKFLDRYVMERIDENTVYYDLSVDVNSVTLEDSGFDIRFGLDAVALSSGFGTSDVTHSVLDLGYCVRLENVYGSKLPYTVMPRSSFGKSGLILTNSIGMIDKGYTGNLMMAVYNPSTKPVHINKGQRLIQVVQASLEPITALIITSTPPPSSKRGKGGHGSTGV